VLGPEAAAEAGEGRVVSGFVRAYKPA
jgi:hypothetical protein